VPWALSFEPEADPLNNWLGSLVTINQRVPDDVLALPAHNNPFTGLHARVDELIESYRRGLQRLQTLLTEPRRLLMSFRRCLRVPSPSCLRHTRSSIPNT
jgi:hypothetical protein